MVEKAKIEQDFENMSDAEKKEFGLFKLKQTEEYSKALKEERHLTCEDLKFQVRALTRELEFKKVELVNGVVEKNDGMIDGLKQVWQVENDIDQIGVKIADYNNRLSIVKELLLEEAKKSVHRNKKR